MYTYGICWILIWLRSALSLYVIMSRVEFALWGNENYLKNEERNNIYTRLLFVFEIKKGNRSTKSIDSV